LAVSNEFKVVISDKANGYSGFQQWLLDFEGKELRMPQKDIYRPDIGFTQWHVKEVFQGEYN
jgi:putative restriction endonuclease